MNSLNENGTSLIPVFAGKVKTNAFLREQEAKGLSWTAILAGPAFDWVSSLEAAARLP